MSEPGDTMTEVELERINPEIEDRTFDLGKVVMTQGVASLIAEERIPPGYVHECLQRHQMCDWGDLSEEDKKLNDKARRTAGRILSAYESDGIKIWIVTEWDRSVTTALLPSEY